MITIVFFAFICLTKAADPTVRLGEPCIFDSDCYNEWAFCNDKKICACQKDFTQDQSGCKPKNLYCPDVIVEGQRQRQIPTGPCEADSIGSNCSRSDFCFLHSNARTQLGYFFGHCCPKPFLSQLKTACPTAPSNEYNCSIEGGSKSCPTKTNNCYNDIPNSLEKSCCPQACPGGGKKKLSQFSIEGTGRCFTEKDVGQICEYSAECPENTSCRKNPANHEMICQSDF